MNRQVESAVPLSPIKSAQEIAESGRIEEAAAQRGVEAKTARLKALRLAKEEADRKPMPKPSAAHGSSPPAPVHPCSVPFKALAEGYRARNEAVAWEREWREPGDAAGRAPSCPGVGTASAKARL